MPSSKACHAWLWSAAVVGASWAASFAQSPPPAGSVSRAPDMADGAAIYQRNCAGCHGADLAGGRGPSLFNAGLIQSLGDVRIRATILNGNGEMPAFKGTLTAAQITTVIAYLHTQSAAFAPATGGDRGRTGAAAAAAGPPTLATPLVPNPVGQVMHSEKQDFRIEAVATGLVTPWGMAFLPDGRLLITERPGRLRIVDADGRLEPQPVAGLPKIHVGQDAGLLDVAVGPDYANDGWVYLSYVDEDPSAPEPPPAAPGTPYYRLPRKPSMTVWVRGKIVDGHWTDQHDLFRAPYSLYTPRGEHYGSRFLFDKAGHVFFSMGERGDMANAPKLDVPLGKIHRVNLDGSVPTDNPFVHRSGAAPTIWSYGHRNPEGLATDPATGLMWETEHGPNGGDEVNVITKGANYGWGVASMGQQPGITKTTGLGLTPPVAFFYPTVAPSGIAFYTGKRFPAWTGSLFVSGLRGQQLRRLTVKGRKVLSQEVILNQLGRVRDITTGPDGLLYVMIQNPTGPGTGIGLTDDTPGEVVRLVPITWSQDIFKR